MNLIAIKSDRLLCCKSLLLLCKTFVKRSESYYYFSTINDSINDSINDLMQNNLKSKEFKSFEPMVRNTRNTRQRLRHELNKSREEVNTSFDPHFSDTFGTLSSDDKSWQKYKRLSSEDLPEDDDRYDELEIKRGPKMAKIGYTKLLTEYVHKKPIQMKKALQLYNKMISEDRIPPDKCTYTVLISGCAKVGYTQKAFQLFEELLKYNLKPTKHTITALFNACAECPFTEYGLERAQYLREWLNLEGVVANTFHYHSMIKAFGKLGDLKTAFQLVDEMVSNGQSTSSETFAMLLMGCISDTESGLYHAIRVVRKMMFHNLQLDIYTFNLLLRCVRDCGIGSDNDIKSLIYEWNQRPNSSSRKQYPNEKVSQNPQNYWKSSKVNSNNCVDEQTPHLSKSDSTDSLVIRTPNLLYTNRQNQSQVIDINVESLSSPLNRFLLFGGMKGFFQMMNEYNVKPNVNSVTLMLELIDLSKDSDELLNALEMFKIKADTDFFNILLKGICLKSGIRNAKNILLLMQKKGLQFDIITFGVLSLGCNSLALGKQLLYDMEKSGLKPNTQIMGGLALSACKVCDFWYLNFLINQMKKYDIRPSQMTIERMQTLKLKVQKTLAEFDRKQINELPVRYESEAFRKGFAVFKSNYEEWLQTVTVDIPDHPWDQFKFQHIDDKEGMHNFVAFMKQKINQRRGLNTERQKGYYEEEELYDE